MTRYPIVQDQEGNSNNDDGSTRGAAVRRRIFSESVKRGFDLSVACFAIVLLAPLLLAVALAVRLCLGGPVLFRQVRPGRNGKPFVLLKFRTMIDLRDEEGRMMPDDRRITKFGSFLRHSSLDELPELWNVCRGEMSLVGPRPLLMEYLPLYSSVQARRHEVRPGLTGWAQIHGRNSIGWEEKFRLDVWYVDNRTFWLDLRILWLTIGRVLEREGVSSEGTATMPKFTGSGAGK